MAEDYWGDGYWGLGYWATGYWGQGGTAAAVSGGTGDKYVGRAVLKRKLDNAQLEAIKAFFEALR